jgi:hypothetical protein
MCEGYDMREVMRMREDASGNAYKNIMGEKAE